MDISRVRTRLPSFLSLLPPDHGYCGPMFICRGIAMRLLGITGQGRQFLAEGLLMVVMSYETNHLLYDYYNFPEEMYKVKFESKGSPAVASRVVELLKKVSPTLSDGKGLKLMLEWNTYTDVKAGTGVRSWCLCPIQINVHITLSDSDYRNFHGRDIRSPTINRSRKSLNPITVPLHNISQQYPAPISPEPYITPLP
jgi:hypothetical protein